MVETTTPLTESTPVKASKKCMNILMCFVLLLFIFMSAALGYLYYTGMQFKRMTELQLNRLELQNISQAKMYHLNMMGVRENVHAIQSRLNQVYANKNGMLLFQLNEIISLANQSIVVYNDIVGSIRLLSYAKNMLESNNDAAFVGLKFSVSSDLTKLNNLPLMDKVMLSGKLDGMLSEVSKLHLDKTKPNSTAPFQSQSLNNSKWSRFINDIKNTLFGLISVNSSDKSMSLLPNDEVLLKNVIMVDLLGAKIALMNNDQAGWIYNLTNLKSKLVPNFANYQGINNLEQELLNLLQVDISNHGANIDATLTQLNKLNNSFN